VEKFSIEGQFTDRTRISRHRDLVVTGERGLRDEQRAAERIAAVRAALWITTPDLRPRPGLLTPSFRFHRHKTLRTTRLRMAVNSPNVCSSATRPTSTMALAEIAATTIATGATQPLLSRTKFTLPTLQAVGNHLVQVGTAPIFDPDSSDKMMNPRQERDAARPDDAGRAQTTGTRTSMTSWRR
jgi:hypothetical protein